MRRSLPEDLPPSDFLLLRRGKYMDGVLAAEDDALPGADWVAAVCGVCGGC